MKPDNPGLTAAVIPCLNEAAFISAIVKGSKRHVDSVIVVDDGSSDDTSAVAQTAGAEVIRHENRMGAGAATRSGFLAALRCGADIIVTLDGDGQHDPDEIPHLLKPFESNMADLVIGSRFIQPNHNMPRYRKFGIDVITTLYNLGSSVRVTDAQSGFRAHSRRLLESVKITRDDFSFSIEMLVQARVKGFRINEVPVSCLYHAQGSSLNPVVHGMNVALNVLLLRLAHERQGYGH